MKIAVKSLLVLLCALVSCATADATKTQYILERSLDGVEWTQRASFVVTRSEPTVSPKLKVGPIVRDQFPIESIKAATLVHYRVREDGAPSGVSIVTTPCGIVRSFEATSAKVLTLFERLSVSVGEGTTVVGLQLNIIPNPVHAANGDCDLSILTLFPEIDMQTSVALMRPTEPKIHTKYEDGVTGGAAAPPPPKKEKESQSGGKDSAAEPQEDNRTFIEKYWWYIVIFGIWTVVNVLLGPKAGAEKK